MGTAIPRLKPRQVGPLTHPRHVPRAVDVKARNLLGLTRMPIRVTTISEASGTLVKIDGWFRAEDVDDFVRMFEQLVGDAALDLRELLSADRAAVVVLRELIVSGVELRAASPYVDLLLKAAPGRPSDITLSSPRRSRGRKSMDG